MMGERVTSDARVPARIKVVGVGGGGCNAVRRMMQHQEIPGVEHLAINTDVKALDLVSGATPLQIGSYLTHGFGSGGNATIGEQAAEESRLHLERAVRGADLVFIAVGMGGGTGTGASPIVAEIARESGAMVIAVMTVPFSFEGRRRFDVAMSGLRKLVPKVNNTIIIPNDRLLKFGDHDVPVSQAFAMADDVIGEGILSISQLINVPGEINVDMADVKAVMNIQGAALMSTGWGDGKNGALEAAEQAVSNPLLDTSISGAKGVLFNFSGGPDMSVREVNGAASLIARELDPNALIFFGMNLPDEELEGRAKITLVATGIKTSVYSGWTTEVGPRLKSAMPRRFSFGIQRKQKAAR
jgi:cell division protein FtsZ